MRLVMCLAADGGQLTISELATREGLPEPTVAKVVGTLRRAGLAEAARGRNGGYRLAQPAEDLTLAHVVAAFDDSLYDATFCQRMKGENGRCLRQTRCGLRPVWRGLTEVIGRFLSEITVADVIGSHEAGSGAGPAVVQVAEETQPMRAPL